MYALTNDGARLFFTTENYQNLIFNNDVYISTNDELEQLKIFNDRVIKEFRTSDCASKLYPDISEYNLTLEDSDCTM